MSNSMKLPTLPNGSSIPKNPDEANMGDDVLNLDPHLSIFNLLEQKETGSSEQTAITTTNNSHKEGSTEVNHQQDHIGNNLQDNNDLNNSEDKLPESWLEVKKSDIDFCNDVSSSISHTNTNGVLSSSDTSEEDAESQTSQSNNNLDLHANLELTQCNREQMSFNLGSRKTLTGNNATGDFGTRDLLDLQYFPVEDRNKLSSIGFTEVNETDSVTITKSMSASTSSFMMPKLSSKEAHQESTETADRPQLRILILGRLGLQFWKNIPTALRELFLLPRSLDTKMYERCYGIIIVIEEANELMNVLNKVSDKIKTTIPIATSTVDKDNIIQIRNITNSYAKRGIITQMYPSFVSSEREEQTKFLFFVSSIARMSREQQNNFISRMEKNKPLSSSSSEGFKTARSSRTNDADDAQLPQSNNYFRNKSPHQANSDGNKYVNSFDEPKTWLDAKVMNNKWFIFGMSFSVGFGVGYSLSYFTDDRLLSSSMEYICRFLKDGEPEIVEPTPPDYITRLNNIMVKFKSFLQLRLQGNISCCIGLIKETLKNLNLQLRNAITDSTNFLETIQFTAANPKPDLLNGNNSDPHGKILSLGYILI